MAKPKLVRVKLANGLEASVGESFAKSHDLKVLDKPATDRAGRARRTKPKTSVAKAAASKSTSNTEGSDQPASSKEESK